MEAWKQRLVLASGSPRRDELLYTAGLEHEVIVSGASEDVMESDPRALVEELSRRKAMEVYDRILTDPGLIKTGAEENYVVIGADTVVVLDNEILGKPRDEEDAADMLRKLSGRAHHVCTGVTLQGRKGTKTVTRTFSEVSFVYVAPLTEEEIRLYIATGEPMDKAGAYGIQGVFSRHVTRIEGDYFNIVGLPVSRVYRELKELF